jgi:hypothetical protein
VSHCRSLQGKGLNRLVECGYRAQQDRRVGCGQEKGLTGNLGCMSSGFSGGSSVGWQGCVVTAESSH